MAQKGLGYKGELTGVGVKSATSCTLGESPKAIMLGTECLCATVCPGTLAMS